MKYLIIGAGGTGGAIGGFLARAGKDVTFIDKGVHLEKIKTSGLYLETPNGEYMISAPAYSTSEYSDVPDVIFVCVKGYSLDEVLPFIERVADSHTVIIPILGIYGTYSKIQDKVPGVVVTDGCVYITSEIKEPGTVMMSGRIFRVIFGLPKGAGGAAAEKAMPVLEMVRQDLRVAGVMSVLSSRIEIDTLQKFSYVSPMAAVGAGYDVSAWSIQVPGELQNIFKALVQEVKWLSDAMDCSLPEDIVDINLAMMKNQPPETITSMHRDILEGKESELDGIVFEVIRMGKKFGVDVPTYREIAGRFPGMVPDYEEKAEEPLEEIKKVAEEEFVEEIEEATEEEFVEEIEEAAVIVNQEVVEAVAEESVEIIEEAAETFVTEEVAEEVAEEVEETAEVVAEEAVEAGAAEEVIEEAVATLVTEPEELAEDELVVIEETTEEADEAVEETESPSEEVAEETEETESPVEEVTEEIAESIEVTEEATEEFAEADGIAFEKAVDEEEIAPIGFVDIVNEEGGIEFETAIDTEETVKGVDVTKVSREDGGIQFEVPIVEVEETEEPAEEVAEEAVEAIAEYIEEPVETVAEEEETEEPIEEVTEEAMEAIAEYIGEPIEEVAEEIEESTEEVADEAIVSEENESSQEEEPAVEEEFEAEDDFVVDEIEEIVAAEEPAVEEDDDFVVEEVSEEDDDFFEWEEVEIIEGMEEISEEVTEEVVEEQNDAEEPVTEELTEEDAYAAFLEEEAEDGEPRVHTFEDGSKFWKKTYDKFEAKVFIPVSDPITDIVNFGFMTPYLLVFEEERRAPLEAKAFAEESGLAEIAAGYGGSVVSIYPTNEGGWEEAPEDLFASLISNTKISQYYHDGMAVMRNRFNGEWGESYIRGALLRSYLYGYGKSADYIAQNLLKTVEGDGLYGKGDITPVICVLENLSVIPQPERRDIPVVSIGNSAEINEALTNGLDAVLIKENAEYVSDFNSFMKKYRRMVGYLNEEPDLEEMGVAVEPDYCVVPTAADNRGDDADTTEHKIGYVAYYKKGIMNKEEVPLVLCFHGGGDSAMCMVALSDWHLVVAKNEFLLVSVENHLNSTATEMMSLLAHLKAKYSIDTERIYATGFSMGGCKSWDMFQEYPYVFAALAPMDATFDVGQNAYGQPVENINREIPVPVFYVGGEQTPLPELPFQAQKCTDRMAYVLEVNQSKTKYDVQYEERENWENPIWGIDGDVICKDRDENRGSVLTMHLFESENGCCYSVFGSGSPQQHEMRYLNCKNAWKFFTQFRRLPNGALVGGSMEDVINVLSEE